MNNRPKNNQHIVAIKLNTDAIMFNLYYYGEINFHHIKYEQIIIKKGDFSA
jgi:hypothetical protein